MLALLAVTAACGHPEKSVVDSYFNAVNAHDNQTLSSFAVVSFDKKVQSWTIKKTLEETKTPVALPDLVAKVRDAEKALADNTKVGKAYGNDHSKELDASRALNKKGAPVPAKLQAVSTEWENYNKKDRELKKALAEAKDAVEKEKRNAGLSLGGDADLEGVTGDVVTKKILLGLTIDGQARDYIMTLRKYDVKGAGRSRWMIQGLAPA